MGKKRNQKNKSDEIKIKKKNDLTKMDSSADSSMNSGDESEDGTDNADISHTSQASITSSDFDYSGTTEYAKSLSSSTREKKPPLTLFSPAIREMSLTTNLRSVSSAEESKMGLQALSSSTREKKTPFILFSPTINMSLVVNLPSVSSAEESKMGSQVLPLKFADKVRKTSDYNWHYIIFGVIVSICFAIVVKIMFKEEAPISELNSYEQFVNKIETYKNVFPSQNQRFWRTIKASGRHVLNVTSPDYPAVLLFVANTDLNKEDKFDASSCLARKISGEFDAASKLNPDRSPIVDCAKLDGNSNDRQKLDFDKNLNQYLSGNYKSVIVDHLESLSPTAALMLHGYCDGDNAPFKDVMIILVLHVNNDGLDPRSAEKLLKTSWLKELRLDKVDALMSQVANNIVIVQPESNKLSTHCT